MKSLEECLQALIRTAGGDGNLLFNVGPMPDGRIEDRQIDRLKEMGAWFEKNGETIYATRGGPWKPSSHIDSTRKDDKIYIHLLRKVDGPVTLPALPVPVSSAKTLNGQALKHYTLNHEMLAIEIPDKFWDPIDTIVQLTIEGDSMDIAPRNCAAMPTIPGATATASVTFGNDPQYAANMILDGDPETRWATPSGTKQAWLQVDFANETAFSGIAIEEALSRHSSRVTKFELRKKSGDDWTTIHRGMGIGAHFKASFEPVTTTSIRLEILDAIEGPTFSGITLIQTP